MTYVLNGSARSHAHGVSEIRCETSLLGVNSVKGGTINPMLNCQSSTKQYHLLNQLKFVPDPVHEGVQSQSQLRADDDIPSIVLRANLLDCLDRYRVHLVEHIEARHVLPCSEQDVDELIR